jgi:tetratricopeptide (TPR) repeat protein
MKLMSAVRKCLHSKNDHSLRTHLLLIGLFVFSAVQSSWSQRSLAYADSMFDQGDYIKSKELYEQIAKSNPTDIKAQSGLALTYGKLGDFKNALTCWKNCLKLDSTESAIYFHLGLLYQYEIKSKEDPLFYYDKSLKLDSLNYFTLYYLGKYYSENRNDHLAEKYFLKSLNYCCPEFSGYVFFELGVNHYNRKLYKKAIDYFSKSLLAHPGDCESYEYRAMCYNELYEFDKYDTDMKLYKKCHKAERSKKDIYVVLPCPQGK